MPATVADVILRNKHFLDQFTNGISEQLIKELQQAQKDILEKLTQGNLNVLTRRHYRAVLAETQSILKNTYGSFEDTILSGVSNAARTEYWSIANAIRTQAGLDKIAKAAPLQGIPAVALKEIMAMPTGGGLLSNWIQKSYASATYGIDSVLVQGLIRGQGMYTVASQLRKQIGMSMRGAEVLARTSIMEASNRALDRVYNDYDKYILKYRFLATLDHITCPVCAAHDGETKEKLEDLEITPIHPSCRCVRTPVTRFESDETMRPYKVIEKDDWGKKRPKIAEYGKVPAKENYSEWFGRQDAWFQKRWLGPNRYAAYKSGGLDLKNFVRNNQVLTLDKLEEVYDIDLSKFVKGKG